MSGLLLPVDARREMALEAKQRTDDAMRYWDPLLRDIDHRLSLRRAYPHAMSAGIFPGMWHIIRKAEGAPFTAWVISQNGLGVPGPYREMGHDVLDELKRGDLWSKTARYEREQRARRVEESKERAQENYREARRDDLAVNVKAMINPGVSRAAKGARAKARKKA